MATPRVAVVFAALALHACSARFDAGVPRPYKCVDRDAGACPGTWVCNRAVGVCIDPDAGLSIGCQDDRDCGGGYRCSPSGTCVDRTVEGTVTSGVPPDGGRVITPLLRPSRVAVAQERTLQLATAARSFGAALLGAGESWVWVPFVRTVTDGFTELEIAARPVEVQPPLALTTTTPDDLDGGDHRLYFIADGGALAFVQLDGARTVVAPGPFLRLSPVRSTGRFSGPTGEPAVNRHGMVAAWRADGGAALHGSGPWGPIDLLGASVTDELAVYQGDGGPRLLVAGLGGLVHVPFPLDGGVLRVDADGGTVLATSPVTDLRLGGRPDDGRTWVAWLSGDRVLWQVPEQPPPPDDAPACPDDAGITTFGLVPTATGMTVATECAREGVALISPARSVTARAIPPRISGPEGTVTWSFTATSGALATGLQAAEHEPITLPQAPDGVGVVDGHLILFLDDATFRTGPLGFTRWRTYPSVFAPAATDGDWLVTRGGLLFKADDLSYPVAVPPEGSWNTPTSPVLLQVVGFAGAGAVVLAHDDSIDVADIRTEGMEVTPRLRPSPGFPVTDVALRSVDGGVEGYAIARGELFEIKAATPRRWSSTARATPAAPLHVYFDGERPRAILDDGAVYGITSGLRLTPETSLFPVAATSVCGRPFLLTASALYALDAAGSWVPVALEGGVEEGRFSRGRLLRQADTLLVFAQTGQGWAVEVPCP